jgi:hypothetical protein
VAASLPFSEDEFRLLAALLKRKVRFMIVGLSAATLQGAPVVTQDVHLWFEKLGEQKISDALRVCAKTISDLKAGIAQIANAPP